MWDGETMQQEFEDEFESEFESGQQQEYEGEYEGEEFLGDVLKGVGGALGLFEGEGEYEYEYEDESEAFFKKLKGIASKLAPVLKKVAPIAAKAVGTAIGGPGVGQALGSLAGQLAREGEFEYEFESEYEYESEYEATATPQPEALAEALAAIASQVQSEAEAEAYTGAFTARIIPIKTASMARISPKVVKGAATLTRTLRKHPATRPLVKTVPTIVARTGQKLAKQAAQGKPVTPTTAAQVMAGETKKVLGNPMTCAKALVRSTEAAKKVAKAAPAKQSEYECEYEGEWEIEYAQSPEQKKMISDAYKIYKHLNDTDKQLVDRITKGSIPWARNILDKWGTPTPSGTSAPKPPKRHGASGGKRKRQPELYEFYY
ncbi:MAG TPA: hypothetical protein DCY91_05160 [Cyanobacteria bacterium UBA11370]|nr:hypothetical protein [Cyanobacteria bacterium UBA11370]HBY81228.1 hypothetical protein [Cyanobacteria bacterium UBA11148]